MKRLLLAVVLANFLLAGCTSTASSSRTTKQSRMPDYPVTRVEEMLQPYPGVHLLHSNGRLEVRIRRSHQEPLYIVDGLTLTPNPPYTLAGLSPEDIATIEVLTDPADLASYGGFRGANGIVLITTKRAR